MIAESSLIVMFHQQTWNKTVQSQNIVFFFLLIDEEKQVKQKVHGKTYKSIHSHWLSVHIILELSMLEDWARVLGYGTGNIIKRNLLVN